MCLLVHFVLDRGYMGSASKLLGLLICHSIPCLGANCADASSGLLFTLVGGWWFSDSAAFSEPHRWSGHFWYEDKMLSSSMLERCSGPNSEPLLCKSADLIACRLDLCATYMHLSQNVCPAIKRRLRKTISSRSAWTLILGSLVRISIGKEKCHSADGRTCKITLYESSNPWFCFYSSNVPDLASILI